MKTFRKWRYRIWAARAVLSGAAYAAPISQDFIYVNTNTAATNSNYRLTFLR